MGEVIRAVAGFSWAVTLFGARQIGNLARADTDRATAAFTALTEAARSSLGEDWDQIFRTGERWQSLAVDRLIPIGMEQQPIELGLEMLTMWARLLETFPGQESAGLELANKTEAVRGFKSASVHGRDMHAPKRRSSCADDVLLATRVEEAAAIDPYRSLWKIEGLGFAWTEDRWRGEFMSGRLLDPSLPTQALVPLHTGMGLSLAMRTLGAVETRDDGRPLRDALERFLALSEKNSAPDCQPMVFEALGLVVRTLYPHALDLVDRLLTDIHPELRYQYWHGVGRGLYFTPSHVLPGIDAWSTAIEKSYREPPHEAGQRNALAGFAWALTLVNIRHPRVLADFLRECADQIFDPAAFTHGVSSALLVWYSANGREAYLENFLTYLPEQSVITPWQRWVSEPGEEALDAFRAQGGVKELAALFRCEIEPVTQPKPTRCRGTRPELGLPAEFSRGLDGWISRAFQAISHGSSVTPHSRQQSKDRTSEKGSSDESGIS